MDDAFVAKTHAELARIVASVKAVRRSFPEHRPCSDSSACKPCSQIRDAHLLITDHLDQLEGIDPVFETESLPDVTQNRECGVCGRARYSNFKGVLVCLACDGYPHGSWVGSTEESL